MNTTVPLDQVARRIAQQEADLAALRRDYEARKRHLADLTRRKQQLQSQLDNVEADIRSLSGAGIPAPAPAAKPAAPAKPHPGAAKGKAKTKAKGKSGATLVELVQTILREAGRPLTHRQLTDELTRRKFRTKTADLLKQVTTRVGEMVKKGLLRRTKDGAATLPGGPQASAPAAKSGPAPAGGKPLVKPGAEQPSLRAVLTSLLEKSKSPLPGGELARLAKAGGYQSTSVDFPNLVHVTLNKMNNIQRIKGQGYRLKK